MKRILLLLVIGLLGVSVAGAGSEPLYLVFTGVVSDVEYNDDADQIPDCQPDDPVQYLFLVDFEVSGHATSRSGKKTVFNSFTTALSDVRYFYSRLIGGTILDDPNGYFKQPGVDYIASNNFGFQYDFINDFEERDDFIRLVGGNSNDELTVEIHGVIDDLKDKTRATAWYSSFDAEGNQRVVISDLVLESISSDVPEGYDVPYP